MPSSPAPTLSPEEQQHIARFDAAIAKARDYPLSADNAARIRDAVNAITETELPKGKTLRDGVADPAGRKLVDWFLYRGGYGTAGEIRAFMVANPTWPDRERLTQRAEEALFKSTASPREVKAFFADTPPTTGVGLATLAAALAADNDQATAKALAAKAWVEFEIPAVQEAAFVKKVGPLLTEADHKRRLDRLLLSPGRWASERSERAAAVRRVIALLPESEKKKAEARLAVYLKAKNSNQLLNKLPPLALKTEWGLAIQKAQALRRQNKNEEAWKILLSEPEATLQVKPDGWWHERRAGAYSALKANKAKTAYDLVRNPGQLSINAHNNALFMAGWIALRHLSDAKAAQGHFEAYTKSADGPLGKARANYWLGRTHEVLGDQAKARESYQAAATFSSIRSTGSWRGSSSTRRRARSRLPHRRRQPPTRSPVSTRSIPCRPPCSPTRPTSTGRWCALSWATCARRSRPRPSSPCWRIWPRRWATRRWRSASARPASAAA